MKSIRPLCGLMLLLAGISAGGVVRADVHHGHINGMARVEHRHHGHVDIDLFFGAPFFYYPPPYYYPYYPSVITVPVEPPVYIEQEPGTSGTQYWYHCDNPEGYYPYIKNCPGGWQRVTPAPPP